MRKIPVTTEILPLLDASSVVYMFKKDAGRSWGRRAPLKKGRNGWAIINKRRVSYFWNGSLWIPTNPNCRPSVVHLQVTTIPLTSEMTASSPAVA